MFGKKPIFGICMGHQVLAQAYGGTTFKLKFGHRGSNHPVQDLRTGRVYITSQNHGYAVDDTSLADFVEITHRSVNDGTVEGKQGALLLTETQEVYHAPACRGKVVNSVGAGDSMVAGFLYGYLREQSYAAALRYGTACGSASAFSKGIADRETVEELLVQLKEREAC